MKKIKFTWKQFDMAVENLVIQIQNETEINFDSIYGVARGGLILAVVLSHQLSLPLVQKIGKNTLVVDDINDTGETLASLNRMWGLPAIATIHEHRETKIKSDYLFGEVKGKIWVVYPWELKNSLTKKDHENN